VGPRLDARPDVNAAMAARAAARGVDVLLSGDGSDELLGVPRYATAAVAARHGVRAARRYAADVAASGPGLSGEALAVLARCAPARLGAAAYWAANWPEWQAPTAPAILAEPYRSQATAWGRAWVAERIAGHAAAGRSWAQADAYDAFYPHEVIGAAGPVPEASPFLTKRFIQAAFAVPLADRYRADLPSGYWRCKSLVLSLLPPAALARLPRDKQYFSTAIGQRARALDAAGPLLVVDSGLIDRMALAAERDPAVLLAVAAVEEWLRGAVEHGATLTGLTLTHTASGRRSGAFLRPRPASWTQRGVPRDGRVREPHTEREPAPLRPHRSDGGPGPDQRRPAARPARHRPGDAG
jgi:Asparagine synthase